jgi:uncharacterized membrane protein
MAKSQGHVKPNAVETQAISSIANVGYTKCSEWASHKRSSGWAWLPEKAIRMPKAKAISRFLPAIFMVGAGIMHFLNTDFYVQIIPTYLPIHLESVYLSGVCEIGLALLLLVPRYSNLAAWGIIGLLVAVFPANIHLYQHHEILPLPPIVHLLRLPIQAVFILWAYWHTKRDEGHELAVGET